MVLVGMAVCVENESAQDCVGMMLIVAYRSLSRRPSAIKADGLPQHGRGLDPTCRSLGSA